MGSRMILRKILGKRNANINNINNQNQNLLNQPWKIQALLRSLHTPAVAEEMSADERFLRYNSPEPKRTDHTDILTYPATRVTRLGSGLRVATESNACVGTATVGVWIDAGSRFETAQTNGTAHFLEHMIFKGTARRPVRALEEEIEDMGGHLNAYTSREQTTYFAKVLQEDVPVALDILADILQNSCFHQSAIERERDVILREMEEVEGQTEEVVFDHLHAAAFCNSSLGRTILGPAENIRTISRRNLREYISTHYSGPRMVVSAAGAVKHEEIVEQVKKLFTNLSTDPTTVSQLVEREPAVFMGCEARVLRDDMPLAQFAVACEGASWTDPDSVAMMVLQTLLGGWNKSAGAGAHMGSELARKVAKNDLAESIMAFNTNYKDTGLFGVYAVAKPECLEDLSYTIINELIRLTHEVQEVDVARACNQLKSCLVLHIDGTSPVAEDIGRQLLTYGRRIPYAELFARIDTVDVDAIKRVARRLIVDKDVAIAGVGPIQHLPDYNWFRHHMSSLDYKK